MIKKIKLIFLIFLLVFICVLLLTPQSAHAAMITPNSIDPCGPDGGGCNPPPEKEAIIILPGILGSKLLNANGNDVWLNETLATNLQNGHYFMSLDKYLDLVQVLITLELLNLYHAPAPLETWYPNNTQDDPINGKDYGTLDIYRSIYDDLYTNYHDKATVVFFQYDWRQDITKSALELQDYIDTSHYTKVVLVAHSMGGLVAAKYLALQDYNRGIVKQLNTLGSPLFGTPEAFFMLETGDMKSFVELNLPIIIDSIVNGLVCFEMSYFPSIYEMMHNSEYYQFNSYIHMAYLTFSDPLYITPFHIASYNETLYTRFKTPVESFKNSLYVNNIFVTNLVPTNYFVGIDVNKRMVNEMQVIRDYLGTKVYFNVLNYTTDSDSDAPIFSASAGHISSYDGYEGYKGNGVYEYEINHMDLIDFGLSDFDYYNKLRINIESII